MAMQPARVKYRKMHRGSRAGTARNGHTVAFGEYGLMSLERCWLDAKQIESRRKADRVCARGHRPQHETAWQDVDSCFSAKIVYEETFGNANGQG
jgi:ribosomal protein L16/L10AE